MNYLSWAVAQGGKKLHSVIGFAWLVSFVVVLVGFFPNFTNYATVRIILDYVDCKTEASLKTRR